jgi:glycosyltransferase involved in cell wall biosynthesis
VTIPNLIDTDFFVPPPDPRKTQPFVFLAVGILEHVKGFDVLIEAFAGFMAMNKGEFLLRIGGRGSKYRKLKALAKRHGVLEWVHLHGYVPREQVRREMQQSHVFVLPSRFEAFGVVLIEAMATGCPVLSTYSGGPEYIVNDRNGILVEPDSAEQLQDAMQKLYDNYAQYNQDEIRKQVVDNYSVEVVRHRYYDLINQVLHGKNKPSE